MPFDLDGSSQQSVRPAHRLSEHRPRSGYARKDKHRSPRFTKRIPGHSQATPISSRFANSNKTPTGPSANRQTKHSPVQAKSTNLTLRSPERSVQRSVVHWRAHFDLGPQRSEGAHTSSSYVSRGSGGPSTRPTRKASQLQKAIHVLEDGEADDLQKKATCERRSGDTTRSPQASTSRR